MAEIERRLHTLHKGTAKGLQIQSGIEYLVDLTYRITSVLHYYRVMTEERTLYQTDGTRTTRQRLLRTVLSLRKCYITRGDPQQAHWNHYYNQNDHSQCARHVTMTASHVTHRVIMFFTPKGDRNMPISYNLHAFITSARVTRLNIAKMIKQTG